MQRKILLIFTLIFLCSCATPQKDAARNRAYFLATRMQSSNAQHHKASKPQSLPIKRANAFKVKKRTSKVNASGENAIRLANRKAERSPRLNRFKNSIMTYDYIAGDLYRIYAAPLCVTDIQFQAGEHIISAAAGDTLRWQVSKTFSGAGLSRQEHLLVKPLESGLSNSLVVTTDMRTYHLILRSTTNTFMASVAWQYKDEDMLLKNLSAHEGRVDEPSSNFAKAISIDNLNFRYSIKLVRGPKPDWFPCAVFNDGKKTYIMFPDNAQEAPILFIGKGRRTNQMVNYRIQGNYYIVDGIFAAAQLHSGYQAPIIVQISYIYK